MAFAVMAALRGDRSRAGIRILQICCKSEDDRIEVTLPIGPLEKIE
jgi:hypothetical protein